MNASNHPESSRLHPRWSEFLRDHRHVVIRPVRKQDRAAERAFIEDLSPEARRQRFMHPVDAPDTALIDSLVDIDRTGESAYVAVVKEDSHEKIVGAAQYAIDHRGGCRCSIVVADEWYEKGLGTLLLRHLIDTAQKHGIHRIYFIAYAENLRLRDLVHFLGFHTHLDPGHPNHVVHELALVRSDAESDG